MKTARREIFLADARLAVMPAVEGKPVTLSGYAIVYGVLSSDRGGYRVRIQPGAPRFTAEVHALWNHEYRDVIGTTANGSLRIMPDDTGIRVEIDLPNTTAGRDVAELVRRRDLRGMSFGIPDEPDYAETTENGLRIRDYSRFLVDEVTVTPIPAFEQTLVGIKDNDGAAPVMPAAPAIVPAIVAPAVVAAPPLVGYARHRAPAPQLARFKFGLLRLPGAEFPARTA